MLPRGKQSVFYVRISLDIITRCFVDFDTKYSKIEKIGQGAFGEAWKVAPRNDPNQIFVMKEIDTKCIIIFKTRLESIMSSERLVDLFVNSLSKQDSLFEFPERTSQEHHGVFK